jgi:hypothetical protein
MTCTCEYVAGGVKTCDECATRITATLYGLLPGQGAAEALPAVLTYQEHDALLSMTEAYEHLQGRPDQKGGR